MRRVPYDLISHYNVKQLYFSHKSTPSTTLRASKSIKQCLENYWFGLRLQNMDIPAVQVVRGTNDLQNNTIHLSEDWELYLQWLSDLIVEYLQLLVKYLLTILRFSGFACKGSPTVRKSLFIWALPK